ncbi:hypothetical protein Tco_0646504 [Tanacetum coccineum]
MEFESTHSNTTAKLPILKLGEYEMWVIRIKQYFQVQDYALWEVIENGNSWVSVPQRAQENGTLVTKMSILVTAEEKTNKKNDVKARSFLLMALPNKHQLTFSQYIDAKTMFAAIETRFGVHQAQSHLTKLQKIVSRLAILSVVIGQEDLNSKFLSILPPEWNTHVVEWMHKAKIKIMSIDDLYNNFKIVEQSALASTNHVMMPMLHMKLVLLPDVNMLSPQRNFNEVDSGSNEFEVVAISAKYEGKEMGHFAKECRAPRSKEGQFRNQDNTRKQGNNEDTSSKAMLAIDGVDSEVYTDKTCSKTCLKNYKTLKKQCDDLIVKLNQTEFTAATYKRGLATVEEQLITYRKNEVLFSEEVAVLKREVACKDYEINVLKSEFEKVKQEKEGIEFKIEKFDKASKDLDKLLGSQITDKSKKGLGYSAVPPPHPLIYNRPKKLDLSYSGLDEFKEPEFKAYGSEDSNQKSNVVCDKKSDDSKENSDDSLVKEQVSKDTSSFVESSLNVDKETVFPVDKKGKPQQDDTGFVDSRCSRHITGNIAYLSDFKEFDGGYVTFGGGAHSGRISGKGTLKTDSLDFEDVYFVNELNFNLFSVSQMCDKKNYVLFTDTECLVLSPNFKLPDESHILLKIPRKDNMYSFDMKNIVMACLRRKPHVYTYYGC